MLFLSIPLQGPVGFPGDPGPPGEPGPAVSTKMGNREIISLWRVCSLDLLEIVQFGLK